MLYKNSRNEKTSAKSVERRGMELGEKTVSYLHETQ